MAKTTTNTTTTEASSMPMTSTTETTTPTTDPAPPKPLNELVDEALAAAVASTEAARDLLVRFAGQCRADRVPLAAAHHDAVLALRASAETMRIELN
jgi:hypothetical protein